MILVLLLLESELPRADCITPSQVSILEPFARNFVGDPFGALQTTFPQVSSFGFMCLVHEPESTRSWHDNELFSSYSKSFHGLVMAALSPLLNVLEKKGKMPG